MPAILRPLPRILRQWFEDAALPHSARQEAWRDRQSVSRPDPGWDAVSREGAEWLLRAQARSKSADGGVARHFSLLEGWSTSYPETTGYIVSTIIDYGRRVDDQRFLDSARTMVDWLVSIQMPSGAFQGGRIDSTPVVPVTFNTGQILLGLAKAVREFGERYRRPMRAAADWLVETQDPDGCWRRFPTPFAKPGEKTYETHVAWPLLEAARLDPDRGYAEAAMKQVHWALRHQHDNGWFEKCCLSDPSHPLTHTIGYALRGVVEAFLFSRDAALLEAARKTADGILSSMGTDGKLAGQLDSKFKPMANWVCLTGTCQIAYCLLELYRTTKVSAYRDGGFAANQFVRRTVCVEGPEDIRGAVKGSFPIDGQYGRFEYLSWATKFAVDSNLLEADIRAGAPTA